MFQRFFIVAILTLLYIVLLINCVSPPIYADPKNTLYAYKGKVAFAPYRVNNNDIILSNFTTEPKTLKVGDQFKIIVSVMNKSPIAITFYRNNMSCKSPLEATFSNNVSVNRTVNIVCLHYIVNKLDAGNTSAADGPPYYETYTATKSGNSTVHVVLNYYHIPPNNTTCPWPIGCKAYLNSTFGVLPRQDYKSLIR